MIVFSGNLNDECKAYMRKRNILSWILSVSIVFIFVAPVIIVFAFCVTKWLFLLLIPLLVMIMIDHHLQRWGYPTYVQIDEDYITSKGDNPKEFTSFSLDDVLKVIDMGTWYKFKFNLKVNVFTICQKDLIVEGTLEEFEEIFKDKLVVYEPKKRRK